MIDDKERQKAAPNTQITPTFSTVQPKHESMETQTNCVRDAAARDHICPPSSGTGERKSAACENSAKLKGSSGLPVLLR